MMDVLLGITQGLIDEKESGLFNDDKHCAIEYLFTWQ